MRATSASPFFPHTVWLSLPGTTPSEKQLRTAGMPPSVAADLPVESSLELYCAGANPFLGTTTLAFYLPESAPVRLSVLDVSGRRVAKLLDGVVEGGRHVTLWDGRDVAGSAAPGGVYFALLEAAGGTRTAKLLLAR